MFKITREMRWNHTFRQIKKVENSMKKISVTVKTMRDIKISWTM